MESAKQFEKMGREQARVKIINEITRLLGSTLEIERIWPALPGQLRRLIEFDRLTVNLVDGDEMEVRVLYDPDGAERDTRTRIPMADMLNDPALGGDDPDLIDELSPDSANWAERFLAKRGFRSALGLPLTVRGDLVGILSLTSKSPATYSRSSLELLRPIAEQLAVAIANGRLYEQAETSAKRFEAISEVSALATAGLDVAETFQAYSEAVRRIIRFDRATISVISPCGEWIERRAVFDALGSTEEGVDSTSIPVNEAFVGKVLRTGQAALRDLRQSALPYDSSLLAAGFQSALNMPLLAQDRVVGAWSIASTDADAYGESDLNDLAPLASALATALTNARLYDETRKTGERVATYGKIGELLNSTVRLEDVYEELADLTGSIASFDEMFTLTYRKSGEGSHIESVCSNLPHDATFLKDMKTAPLDRPGMAPTNRDLTRFDLIGGPMRRYDPILARIGYQSATSLPLVVGGEMVGELVLASRDPGRYNQATQAAMEPIVGMIAAERYRSRLFAEIETMAATDPLTEVPNRRHFDESFERRLAVGRRTASSTGLLSIDLDRFKEFNDTHGHLEGDRILRYVARVLSSCVRTSDMVARYGGDEFVMGLIVNFSRGFISSSPSSRWLDSAAVGRTACRCWTWPGYMARTRAPGS